MFEIPKEKGVKQQVVRDPEKAREMAEIEDRYREFAAALEEYMEDPVAFRAAQREKVDRVAARGAFAADNSGDYMELYRAGVRPRDLERVGERMAEMHAREYDFKREIRSKSALELRACIAWFKLEQLYYQRAYNKATGQVDFRQGERRGDFATHLLNQIGAGDGHAAIAERVHQWISQSEELQQMAEAELTRRKSGSAEPAAA